MTVDPDEIRFELEHLSLSRRGRLELTGRWFGIRGRRFVRPTLLLTMLEDDAERRSLAELEHKPWAAEEGEAWTAAFPVDAGMRPEAAACIELSVAPDITVTLAPDPGLDARRHAARERHPAAPAPTSRPRSQERTQGVSEGERVAERDRVAQEKIAERERVRRKELIADRDRAIAERDQAIAMRDRATVERDRASSEREQATAERDRAIRGGARAASSLRERERELEAANQALRDERTESGRLRALLTRAQALEPHSVSRDPDPGRALVSAPRAESPSRAETLHSDRPRNPSLRARANWFVRILTVLVMLGVIAAILEVVRMTIS